MNNIIFKTLLLKGEAGNDIQSVEKTATSGLVDTYTITLTDGSTHTFNVTNGKSIVSIEKTSSVGYVDTYTITYNDGSTDTFEITLATITVDDALSDSSTNPVENRVVTGALNTKSNNSNLATVESGTTASQAYTVGDYLVYNGQLCKVISAIAQGDTLTVGTNIEVTTSGGEFKKINSDLDNKANKSWQLIGSAIGSGTVDLSTILPNANEILIVSHTLVNNNQVLWNTITITPAMMSSNYDNIYRLGGYYSSPAVTAHTTAIISTNKILTIGTSNLNGSDIKSSTYIEAY